MLRSFVVATLIVSIKSTAVALSIPMVFVGNAGNAADSTGYGAVGYDYRIGTTEVTNSQYVEFLNAKATSDPFGLYDTLMTASVDGGINRLGVNGSYSYTVKPNAGNNPVNWVSWYDAVRFINWLENGQGAGDTETGSYTLAGGSSIVRNSGSVWVLPSENEWYKAAYFNGADATYFDYPTSTDQQPAAMAPPGGANSLNAQFAIVQLTSVGAYSKSVSPTGTFDQAGNVSEWNEAFLDGGFTRGIRGSSYLSPVVEAKSSIRSGASPSGNYNTVGFRVAIVPEPSAHVLAGLALTAMLASQCRSRSRSVTRRLRSPCFKSGATASTISDCPRSFISTSG